MKNIIITAIIIFSAINIYAQTGKIKVIAKTNCSQPNKFIVDIMAQAQDAAENINLANQNYRFSYNGEALANPVIISEGSDLNFNQMVISANGNFALFTSPTLNGSLFETVSLNIEMVGGNGYTLSSTTPTYICSIQFDNIDVLKPINFDWHEEDQFPATYLSSYNDGLSAVLGDFAESINIGIPKPANTGLRANYYCNDNRLRLREVQISAAQYRFQYRTLTNGAWTAWTNSSITSNGIKNIYNIVNSTRVQYRVRVNCGGRWSGWGHTKTYNFPSCKLADNINTDAITAYPNPANQQVTININEQNSTNRVLKIYSLIGEEIQSQNLIANENIASFNTSKLNNGVYLISLMSDGIVTSTQKLTVAH